MARRRQYRQFCGVAQALDRVGERWTLLIIRNLLLGPRRYSDLLAELPGITTNLLAKRLREMEGEGLIEKHELPPPVRVAAYRLTAIGAALEPVILELGRWGWRFLQHGPRRGDVVNIAWGLLSLKRRYTGHGSGIVAFHIGTRDFELGLADGPLSVQERPAARPDVSVKGTEDAFRGWLMAGSVVPEIGVDGPLKLSGPRESWDRISAAFDPPLPLAPPLPRSK